MTVTLRPNVLMQVGSTVTVAGLTGTLTADAANMTLAGSNADVFGSLGDWNQGSGTMTLIIVNPMLPCHTYIFSFVVRNPTDTTSNCMTTFNGTVPTIQADTICVDRVNLDVDETTRLTLFGESIDAGYATPLKLLRPTWEKKDIGQVTVLRMHPRVIPVFFIFAAVPDAVAYTQTHITEHAVSVRAQCYYSIVALLGASRP